MACCYATVQWVPFELKVTGSQSLDLSAKFLTFHREILSPYLVTHSRTSPRRCKYTRVNIRKNSCTRYSNGMNIYSENYSEGFATEHCRDFNLTALEHIAVTVLGFLELVIFVLIQLIGSLVIYCLYRSKMLRDPISALITSVAASFMILSVLLNLVIGISILTDQPSIAISNNIWNFGFSIAGVFQWYLAVFSIGLIATVQFLIVKYGRKRVSTSKVLSAFVVLLFVALVLPTVQGLGFRNATFSKIAGLVRVSSCASTNPWLAVGLILGYLVPFVITLVTTYMTYRTVKNAVVENNSDNSVTKSVLVINTVTVVTILISKVPLFSFTFWATATGSIAAYVVFTLWSASEPFYVLLLFITVHKTIRSAIIAAVTGYSKCQTAVWPEEISPQP